MDPIRLHAQQLDNFRSAWHVLQERVRIALRTQVGDTQRLANVRSQALSLLQSAEQVRHLAVSISLLSLTLVSAFTCIPSR